jgi:hypothetical protein
MCWTDTEKEEGYTFEEIEDLIKGDNPMWCVDTHDLRRIQRRLSLCQQGPQAQ